MADGLLDPVAALASAAPAGVSKAVRTMPTDGGTEAWA